MQASPPWVASSIFGDDASSRSEPATSRPSPTLLLLIAIVGTGLLMKFVVRTDVVSAKAFVLGLVRFHPAPVPADPWFLVHFSLVLFLLVYFPFSKLMHAGGVFFSPSRNQPDWTRSTEPRHVAPF